MSKPFYQVVLFGLIDHRAKGLKTAIQRSLRELGLERTAIRFFDENDVSHLSSGLPTLGVFFGMRERILTVTRRFVSYSLIPI